MVVRSSLSSRRRIAASGNMIDGTGRGQDGLQGGDQLAGEIAQRLALRVQVARIEHLDRHRRAAGRPSVAAPAGDRQASDIVLQLPFSKDVVPKTHMLD